ncbi:alpha/beta fold hydrolase [Nonomuraea sp. NPDC050536]|uniref:alpha/beta fold hydrolase n=1 Tax=Nonomuraea sp. NPDC050536 TaxID=3364366 RepID=UPI0037C6761B
MSEPVFVAVDGRRLRATVRGIGPTVILDTGGAGQGVGTWATIEPPLAAFATVVTYDRAGVGGSDPGPEPRTVARMADDLHALANALDLALPAVLVGWSYGGLVTQVYASRFPQEVAGLVFIDPTPTERQPHLRLGGVWQRTLFALGTSGLVNTGPGEWLARVLYRQGANDEAEVNGMVTFLRDRQSVRETAKVLAPHARNVREVGEAIARYGLPPVPLTVLSAGLRSPTRKGRRLAEWMLDSHHRLASRSPVGKVVVAERASHQIPFDDPEVVIEAVRSVVKTA